MLINLLSYLKHAYNQLAPYYVHPVAEAMGSQPEAAAGGQGRPKTQTTTKVSDDNHARDKEKVIEILDKIDAEICHQEEGGILRKLVGELRSELVKTLLATVRRVEERVKTVEERVKTGSWAPAAKAAKTTANQAANYASVLRATAPETKPVPLRDLREIHVQRANLTPEEAAKPTEEISREINNKFNQLGIGRVLGARRLPSGDLVLLADSADTKRRRRRSGSE